MHLIEDDEERKKCFEEAATFSSESSLRSMFVSALLFSALTHPLAIWKLFCTSFCDDLDHAVTRLGFSALLDINENAVFYRNNCALDYGLHLLDTSLKNSDKSLTKFQLPSPSFGWVALINRVSHLVGNYLILNEMSYLREQEIQNFHARYNKMNATQKQVFDAITASINREENARFFFLQGSLT